jgi:hypothetical protein
MTGANKDSKRNFKKILITILFVLFIVISVVVILVLVFTKE